MKKIQAKHDQDHNFECRNPCKGIKFHKPKAILPSQQYPAMSKEAKNVSMLTPRECAWPICHSCLQLKPLVS